MLPSECRTAHPSTESAYPRPAKARHIRAALLAAGAIVLTLAALPARADVIGAIVGGAVGSQFGKGNGRIASAAIGAVIGDRISGQDRGLRGFSVHENRGHGGYGHHGGHGVYGGGHGVYGGGYGGYGSGHGGYETHGRRGIYDDDGAYGYRRQHHHHHHYRGARPIEYVYPSSTVVYGATPVVIAPAPAYGATPGACVVPPGDYPNGVVCQPPGLQGIQGIQGIPQAPAPRVP